MKNILVTNDDGINGEGLKVLVDCLRKEHNVYVVAPEFNESGVSNSLDMTSNLTLKKREDLFENAWSLNGSPADCVMLALTSKLFKDIKFDLVISGCNKGANLGTDVVYSGTVAGARQACLWGFPAVALSLIFDGSCNFFPLCDFISKDKNIEKLISLCNKDYFININALSLENNGKYLGIRQAKLCKRVYNDYIELEEIEEGIFKTKFSGSYNDAFYEEGSDFDACSKGFISLTLIHAENDCVESGDFNGADFCFE